MGFTEINTKPLTHAHISQSPFPQVQIEVIYILHALLSKLYFPQGNCRIMFSPAPIKWMRSHVQSELLIKKHAG